MEVLIMTMTLGEFIRLFRIKNNYTQKLLAEELGIPGSDADVCRIEKGTERKLGALRARFLVYATTGKYWYARKEIAKSILVHVIDLGEFERDYLLRVILF